MAKKSENRATTFLTPKLREALDKYIERVDQTEAEALRALLTSALRTEKLLDELTK